MTEHPALDLDDIDACPLGERCESCGTRDDIDIATVGTAVGVFCLTLCGTCADNDALPEPASWSHAVRRVLEHCEHLGIDADHMAAQLHQE